jgi:4-alpha-glucanotransferase
MIKNKKYKFAIFVDEHGRERLHLKKLISLLEDQYPFLKQAGRCNRERPITKARVKDVIVFGSSKRSDYAVISAEDYDELTEERRFKLVNLQAEFKKVKKLLLLQ